MQVFIRWQSFWRMQLATQYKGLILKWPSFVRKSFLNLYLSFLITTSLSPQISYLDSMWPPPLQPRCRRELKDLSWGSDNVDVKRATWKGRWTDLSFGPRAPVDQHRNVPRAAGWTASKTSQPICCFIGGLLSLLVHRLIAFYFSLLVWLQHFIEFTSRFTSTTMSDIHAGGKITRQHFNQQPFLCHLRDCYQYVTLIGIFKLQTKINWIRLSRFAFCAC